MSAAQTQTERADVVIAGGGLSGLCLAVQIARRLPQAAVAVVEREPRPHPEAAHKVGESSVELASHYFSRTLGLDDLLDQEVLKFGLRFFMSHGDNRDIAARLECGPSHFLSVRSYQIDRGRFENALAARAEQLGVRLIEGRAVEAVALAPQSGADHEIVLSPGSDGDVGELRLRCRWLVDASGRPGLLKPLLGLAKPNRHDVNAVWFRLDASIDPDTWSTSAPWRSRVEHPRRASTNHLMGPGYWVWLIPLAKDRTSVGIVTDARAHPAAELQTFDRALAWLARHEPQCAAAVRAKLGTRLDFLGLRDYSHDVKQVFSADRWAITGDAGAFVDPLYSPGSDFIGIANGFITDLVAGDLHGEPIDEAALAYDQAFRSLARTFLVTYHRQYAIMGHPEVMAVKVVWDFVMYWGGIALLFFRDKYDDVAFMDQVRSRMQGFARANVAVQALFRAWAQGAAPDAAPARTGIFVDYAEIDFLARLNAELLEDVDDEALLGRLDRNLELAREIEREIGAEVSRRGDRPPSPGPPPATRHLQSVFEALGSAHAH